MTSPFTSSSPAIYTLDLAKHYRNAVALAGLNMSVPMGEVFGFLGPNGAGKTTAVKLLLGLTHPTGGEGWVLGAPLGDRAVRRRIGYLPELFRYQEWLTAREVLRLHCSLIGMPGHARASAIGEALQVVGLASRAGDRVGSFSKGMQQRLGLGVALLGRPDLILLDEPTSALDPVGRHDVREIIRALRERGAAVFLNSHLLSEVEQVCDRVAVVDRGQVIAMGTIADLLGGASVVRFRLAGLSPAAEQALARAGTASRHDGWHVVQGLRDEAVPDLIAQLVGLGCRIYAVEPQRLTLEERFLQLLKGTSDAAVDHRQAHPA
jgi:ABC-2 type transport system ATP-binding protein